MIRIDCTPLIHVARRAEGELEVLPALGDFVPAGAPTILDATERGRSSHEGVDGINSACHSVGLRLNGSAVAQQLQSACDANDDGFGSPQEAQLCTDREFDEIARGEQVLTEELLKAKAENSKGTPAFDEADQNGDGQISRQEWARFSGGAVRPGDRGERRPHERRRVQRVARSGHAGPAAALKATLGLDTARGVAPRALTSLYKSRRPYGRSRADASKLSSWPIEGPGTSRSGYKRRSFGTTPISGRCRAQ